MSEQTLGECDFCGEERRAGGLTAPYQVKANSEQKVYRMLCPVAVKELEALGIVVTESADSEWYVDTDIERTGGQE